MTDMRQSSREELRAWRCLQVFVLSAEKAESGFSDVVGWAGRDVRRVVINALGRNEVETVLT